MLTSLFGDSGTVTQPGPLTVADGVPASDFGALGSVRTTLIESLVNHPDTSTAGNDRHVRELTISGPPAEAMRAHFANMGSALRTTSRMMTLLDPGGLWASSVIKAVSASAGAPMERLQLREHHAMRSLATIERTPPVRIETPPLRVWHAQPHFGGLEIAELQLALMERSELTAVFIGLMEPAEIDALLDALGRVVQLPTWRCATLVVVIPPNAVWIANKVDAQRWPAWISVVQINVPLTSASEVWMALLDVWHAADAARAAQAASAAAARNTVTPVESLGLPLGGQPAIGATDAARALHPVVARRVVGDLVSLDGLLCCAVVDAASGKVIARETREDHPIDLDLAAATTAQLRWLHMQSSRDLGLGDSPDDIVLAAPGRYHLTRSVNHYPGVFLLALLDRQRANLVSARRRMQEVDRSLV